MLKTLVLFVVLVAVAYVALIRHRGWHVDHYAPPARRAHFLGCLLLAFAVASVTIYVARDPVLCPGGATYHEVIRTETATGKGGIGIRCVAGDATVVKGSVFAGICAWLALAIATFASASWIWRRFGPRAPASSLTSWRVTAQQLVTRRWPRRPWAGSSGT